MFQRGLMLPAVSWSISGICLRTAIIHKSGTVRQGMSACGTGKKTEKLEEKCRCVKNQKSKQVFSCVVSTNEQCCFCAWHKIFNGQFFWPEQKRHQHSKNGPLGFWLINLFEDCSTCVASPSFDLFANILLFRIQKLSKWMTKNWI